MAVLVGLNVAIKWVSDVAKRLRLISGALLAGRCIREGKRGYIESTHLPLLERVNISPENWLIHFS